MDRVELLRLIEQLRAELSALVLRGVSPDAPEVIAKSREVDRLVTLYYRLYKKDETEVVHSSHGTITSSLTQ